jgi:hypothetical protein
VLSKQLHIGAIWLPVGGRNSPKAACFQLTRPWSSFLLSNKFLVMWFLARKSSVPFCWRKSTNPFRARSSLVLSINMMATNDWITTLGLIVDIQRVFWQVQGLLPSDFMLIMWHHAAVCAWIW